MRPADNKANSMTSVKEHKIYSPKKVIEVALPLGDINVAAAREKSIHHGHLSTLSLWWARRPLAAARTVIFAQMVKALTGARTLNYRSSFASLTCHRLFTSMQVNDYKVSPGLISG